MKTKVLLVVIAAAALFSFTVIQSQTTDKHQASAETVAEPGAGFASEDKNQWN